MVLSSGLSDYFVFGFPAVFSPVIQHEKPNTETRLKTFGPPSRISCCGSRFFSRFVSLADFWTVLSSFGGKRCGAEIQNLTIISKIAIVVDTGKRKFSTENSHSRVLLSKICGFLSETRAFLLGLKTRTSNRFVSTAVFISATVSVSGIELNTRILLTFFGTGVRTILVRQLYFFRL